MTDDGIRRISVIVPMYNEAEHVETLVRDLAAQDFEGAVEVLVADGRSTDGSVEALRRAATAARLELTIVDNPAQWVSPGLNACIREASGDLIVRLDCHSRYPADYLSRSAAAAAETGAWNVGGVYVAEGRTPMERAVACAAASPFGGVNWTRDAADGRRTETDTVYCGAFRPSVFERVGLYDETLIRNQDDELNLRIRLAGGRIVLDPAIRARYTPRGSLRAVWRQYHQYGRWKVPVMLKHGRVATARSLAPLAFAASLVVLAPAAVRVRPARLALAAEAGLYAAGTLAFGAASIARRKESWRLLPRVAAVFPAFHLGYAAGMFRGWLEAARGR